MEPIEQTPVSPTSNGPERYNFAPRPETRPEGPHTTTPEQVPAVESKEQLSGRGVGDPASLALPIPAVAPQIQVSAQAPLASDDTAVNDNPLAADDVDVIEKEWVNRAKKIIQQTKNDPYQQEHEVSKMQADYLEKRFGVQVKLPQG